MSFDKAQEVVRDSLSALGMVKAKSAATAAIKEKAAEDILEIVKNMSTDDISAEDKIRVFDQLFNSRLVIEHGFSKEIQVQVLSGTPLQKIK